MIYVGILLAHLVGDYFLQSDWMAMEKVNSWWPAIVHGLVYTIPYLFVTQDFWALFIICSTHIVIDRYRLAKHVTWIKSFLGPRRTWYSWAEAKNNSGYSADKPIWMAFWLMVIVDNTMHLIINYAAVLLF